MTNYIALQEESTVPNNADLVGIDADGRVHYYAAAVTDHRVYVATDAESVDVWDLEETPCADLDDWVDHVGEWDDLRYDASLVEMLGDVLEAGA